jgi:hypothetical protein
MFKSFFRRHPALALLLSFALQAALPAAPAVAAETWTVGPSAPATPLREAVARAQDGDTIAVLPGEYDGQVAVITQRRLTIRGIGKRPILRAGGKSAEDKAILVVRGGDITIENLELRGARVSDGNGAGIRFEKGRLTVRNCAFHDNEIGLLTGNAADAELFIEDSVFTDAPNNRGSLPHLLYAGRIGLVQVTGSRFHEGYEGHLIKSRARRTQLAYNFILDGFGGEASYEVDLPNGGEALLVGNVIGQSPSTQNRTLISFGAEGNAWPKSSLTLVHNTLLSPGLLPGRFLRVFPERLPTDAPVLALNNVLAGVAVFEWGVEGRFAGNVHTLGRWLRGPSALDYALPGDSTDRAAAVDLAPYGNAAALRPAFEFALPIGKKELPPGAKLAPGALQ